MKQKDEILILFDGQHLAYSPTVTQLYDALSKDHTITVLAETSKNFINQKLPGYNVIYYMPVRKKPTFIYKSWFFLLALVNKEAKFLRANKIKFPEYHYRFRLLKKTIQARPYKRIIAVDIKNLFYCSLLNIKADFLSLELGASEKLLPLINTSLINCIIIQTKERLEYLFKNKNIKTFFIQNAPIFKQVDQPAIKKGLLYGGTAWDPFGFYHCLNYIRVFKEETLTVQGAVPKEDEKKINNAYKDLVNEKRLIISNTYIENDKVVNYFAQFEIGFCFYNFDLDWINHFNYKSAPSGKLFKYLTAGVPVVAVDIIGFAFVTELKCGVLIKDLSVEKIREAIQQIRNDYAFFAANAISAAKHFSFDKMVQPYIDFVKEDQNINPEISVPGL
jgi:glycosyltransferase involved in cell wall biosynthesis